MSNGPVIDFHMHTATYEQRSPEWEVSRSKVPGSLPTALRNRYDSTASLEKVLADNGLDFGVLLADDSPLVTGVASTEFAVDLRGNSDRLIVFAAVNPFKTVSPAKHVERYVRELGCKGLKLCPSYQYFYPNDPLIYPVYAKAEELGIPVMFHTGSSVFSGSRLKYADPLLLDDVAVDFPELKIVMAHSGRPFWYDRAFFLARLHENVYMEITGLPPQKLLSYFPELERNTDKIIFGSDWPGVRSIKGNIDTIRALPIGAETKDKILGQNAAQLLGLKSSPGNLEMT